MNTGPAHLEAERLALADLGVGDLASGHPQTFGMGLRAGMAALSDLYRLGGAQRVFEAYLLRWNQMRTDGVELMPGAECILRELSARRLPMALVTSGDADYVDHSMRTLGFSGLFASVVTAADVAEQKPSPEPYITAAARLGVHPGACLGFEDSRPGVSSLVSAGMYCVAVNPEAHASPGFESANETYDGLDQFTGADLTRLFGAPPVPRST